MAKPNTILIYPDETEEAVYFEIIPKRETNYYRNDTLYQVDHLNITTIDNRDIIIMYLVHAHSSILSMHLDSDLVNSYRDLITKSDRDNKINNLYEE